MTRIRSIPLESFPWDQSEQIRACDHADCVFEGLYRAPRSPHDLEGSFWFCLEHVREYHKSWNYFSGMSYEEVEAHRRADTIGWRPSWPLGNPMGRFDHHNGFRMKDDFGFENETREGGNSREKGESRTYGLSRYERALDLIGLNPPLTLKRLKTQYKKLVKRYHPDANGGDKKSEEMLKQVIEAYHELKSFLCAS